MRSFYTLLTIITVIVSGMTLSTSYSNGEKNDRNEPIIKLEESEPVSATPQQKVQEAVKQKMTDEEKVSSWKGERVILLKARYNHTPYDFLGEASGKYGYHIFGNRRQGLLYKDYAGKSGVITELIETQMKERGSVIELEHSNEKIVAETSGYLGFYSELEAAQNLIGMYLWVKGRKELVKDFQARKSDKFKVDNTAKLTVVRADWGKPYQPVILYLRTETGIEGCLERSFHFDTRFHLSDERGEEYVAKTYIDDFYLEDPRKLFPGWNDSIWEMIKNEEIAIGMTEDMAKMACGAEMKPVGFIISSSGEETSTIYQCGRWKFLIEKGKVTKYED